MDQEKTIAEIAELVLGIETLETRRMDSLDFHEVAVWSVREALRQAYETGYEFGYYGMGKPNEAVSDDSSDQKMVEIRKAAK